MSRRPSARGSTHLTFLFSSPLTLLLHTGATEHPPCTAIGHGGDGIMVSMASMPATLTSKLRLSWSVALMSGSESSNAFAHIQAQDRQRSEG